MYVLIHDMYDIVSNSVSVHIFVHTCEYKSTKMYVILLLKNNSTYVFLRMDQCQFCFVQLIMYTKGKNNLIDSM